MLVGGLAQQVMLFIYQRAVWILENDVTVY